MLAGQNDAPYLDGRTSTRVFGGDGPPRLAMTESLGGINQAASIGQRRQQIGRIFKACSRGIRLSEIDDWPSRAPAFQLRARVRRLGVRLAGTRVENIVVVGRWSLVVGREPRRRESFVVVTGLLTTGN